MLDFIASSALRPASFTAAAIKSSSSSRSLAELPIAVGSIFTRSTSFFPFIRTVTTPPAAPSPPPSCSELLLHLLLHQLRLPHHLFHLAQIRKIHSSPQSRCYF